jgi:hypothetical protein
MESAAMSSVDDRLTALESELAVLRLQLAERGGNTDWLAALTGSFRDQPEFEEVLRLGQEAREHEPADA